MRILVTGASGFIGRHCLKALKKLDCEVHAFARSTPQAGITGVKWHQGDITDARDVDRALSACRPTHLIHAAWHVGPGYWISPDNLNWAARSAELILAAHRYGLVRAVGIGTCAEYGLNAEICDERNTLLKPVAAYAQSKLATQLLFDAAQNALGVSTAWARLFFPYGADDKPNKLIPYAIRQISKGETAEFSDGKQVRDLLFATDVGDAIVALLMSKVAGAVNIASGTEVRICDLVERIGELMGRPDLIRLGARTPNELEAARWVGATDRLHREVSWRPKVSLNDGLVETIAALTHTTSIIRPQDAGQYSQRSRNT